MFKDKKKHIKNVIICTFLTIALFVPVVFGSILGNTWNTITGKATTDTTSVSITVGNTAPTVDFVGNSTVGSPTITEASITKINISFTATDTDGVSNLNDTSAAAYFQRSGETTRSNTSCKLVGDIDSDTANYTCEIDIWYYDGAGAWVINATVSDINGASTENTSTDFTLQETTAMVMSPTALTWASLSLTNVNQTSNNDPLTINNTANKDISSGNVNITGVNLRGQTTTTEYIPTANFTIDIDTGGSPPAECNGNRLINGTTMSINSSIITAGNNSASQGQEELYFCIKGLPQDISSQTYSTTGIQEWTILIN